MYVLHALGVFAALQVGVASHLPARDISISFQNGSAKWNVTVPSNTTGTGNLTGAFNVTVENNTTPKLSHSGTTAGSKNLAKLGHAAIPRAAPTGGITVHPDGSCQQPLKDGAVSTIDNSAQFPAYNTTTQPKFTGAEAPAGSGGWNAWFKMDAAKPGCRNIIMIPYDSGLASPGLPPGTELVNAGGAGCYFANVPANKDLYTSTCCGAACQSASLNSSLLIPPPAKREAAPVSSTEGTAGTQSKSATARSVSVGQSGSIAARAKSLSERFLYTPPDCQLRTTKWYTQAGEQTVVSDGQRCSGGPSQACMVQVTNQVSFSTTATSETTQTFTTTQGITIGMKEGVNIFGEDVDFSQEFNAQFAEATAKATGQQVMQGNQTSLSYTLPVVLGNGGALTFTPQYNCSVGPLDCGYQPSQPLTVCQPVIGTDGKSLQGEYSVVTYG